MVTTRSILLVAHIVSAVVFLGPATMAASRFPRYALVAADSPVEAGQVELLRSITRAYATSSLVLPMFGFALAANGGFWDQRWLHVAIAVYVAGAVLLLGRVVPAQQRLCRQVDAGEAVSSESISSLRGATGMFSMTWVVVLGLMVIKPW